jgi:hypothetical protein
LWGAALELQRFSQKGQEEHSKLDRTFLSVLAPWPDFSLEVWGRLSMPGQFYEATRAAGMFFLILMGFGVYTWPEIEPETDLPEAGGSWPRDVRPFPRGTQDQPESSPELAGPRSNRDDRLPLPGSSLPRGRV